jgi:hypothetical protein
LRSVPENYPAQRIASASAIAFVQNLKEEVVNEYDAIKIVFDRGKGEETQEILVKDVQDAIRLMPTVSNFLEVPAKNGFAERKKYVDATFLPDSILSVLETMLVQTDSLYGSTTSHQIGGFRMDHLKGTNDPVMVVWAISEKDKAQIPYTFIVSQQSAKIISISTEKNY